MGSIYGYGLTEENYGSVDVASHVFGSENYFRKVMQVEATLAKVESELGLIPEEAAEEIVRKNDIRLLDMDEYARQRQLTEHHLVCLLRVYRNACENGAGEYLHWGATTQDIVDTSVMLQLKEVYIIVMNKLDRLISLLRDKAKQYASLTMCGRTADQQALPITLGFKIAGWVDQLRRCQERLQTSKKRIFVGQFFGAVGTLASLGDRGVEVSTHLMEALGLEEPDIAWYSSRDRVVEFSCDLAQICGALGRLGNEIYIEQKTEINELAEGYTAGKIGSSTMPHKRNPVIPAKLVSIGRMAKAVLVDAFETLDSTGERDGRPLFIELTYLPNICAMTDSALDTAIGLVTTMEVHLQEIRHNLLLSGGLMMSERLMMTLAPRMGRQTAHELIYEIAMQAIDSGESFETLLKQSKQVTDYITPQEIHKELDPDSYTGLCAYYINKVCGEGDA